MKKKYKQNVIKESAVCENIYNKKGKCVFRIFEERILGLMVKTVTTKGENKERECKVIN